MAALVADRKAAGLTVAPKAVPKAGRAMENVVRKVVGPTVDRQLAATVDRIADQGAIARVMAVATVALTVRATAVANAAAATKTKRSNERVGDPTAAGS